MWPEHDYQNSKWFAALWQQQLMNKALILQSIAIVEVLTGYGDIPHVYFLCEMWGKHQMCKYGWVAMAVD